MLVMEAASGRVVQVSPGLLVMILLELNYAGFLNNTPSLFVGQIFIHGDHYSLYQYRHVTNCRVESPLPAPPQ
jgi:hypothetical protein